MYDSKLIDCGVCFVVERGGEILHAADTLPRAFEKALSSPQKPVQVFVACVEALVTFNATGIDVTWVAASLRPEDRVATLS